MGKKVWVKLFGHQNRRILVDSEATDGATIGDNLFWPDGTVVTEAQLRSMGGSGDSTGATIDQNLLNYILANLGKGGTSTDWPLHKDYVESGAILTIPANFEYLINDTFDVFGTLNVESGGELHIYDEGLPKVTDPDFTYNVGGDLTRIDYSDGSYKEFTYNGGGDLTRVDLIRDGVTYRKDFYYSGDELDYVDEYYV